LVGQYESGFCQFNTTKASYFAAADSITTSTASTTTGTGGRYCTTQWTCSAWSACEEGFQTRTCSYPINFCEPTTEKPTERMACTNEEMPVYYGNDTPETEEGFFTLMTGFVIGNLLENPVNMTLSILVLVIIALLLWLVVSKRRAVTKKIKKSKKKVSKDDDDE
jgi:hypothetical protein